MYFEDLQKGAWHVTWSRVNALRSLDTGQYCKAIEKTSKQITGLTQNWSDCAGWSVFLLDLLITASVENRVCLGRWSGDDDDESKKNVFGRCLSLVGLARSWLIQNFKVKLFLPSRRPTYFEDSNTGWEKETKGKDFCVIQITPYTSVFFAFSQELKNFLGLFAKEFLRSLKHKSWKRSYKKPLAQMNYNLIESVSKMDKI